MSRTPEETARLANGVTVETPSGVGLITPVVVGAAGGQWVSHAVMPGIDKEQALVYLAADLAEARAELAALRKVVEMVREWQAARRASTITATTTESWLDLKIANDEREAIKARLLAATLPEVSRG